VNQPKRDIRSFERFFAGASDAWPAEIVSLGATALLALKTLDQPHVAEPLVRAAAIDLSAFKDAYEKHAAQHRSDSCVAGR
jgi:hypothetical protein